MAFGAIWSVWDWTVFVMVASTILISGGLSFLLCICCGTTMEQEEAEAIERVEQEKTKAELLSIRHAKTNLGWTMHKTGEGTKENERKSVKREVVKAEKRTGNDVLGNGKPIEEGGEDKPALEADKPEDAAPAASGDPDDV